jgi:hypothetical protein
LESAIIWLSKLTNVGTVEASFGNGSKQPGPPGTLAVDATPCKKAPYEGCVVSPNFQETIGMAGALHQIDSGYKIKT